MILGADATHICTGTYTVPAATSTTGLCAVPASVPRRADGRPDMAVTVVSGNRFVAGSVYEIEQIIVNGELVADWQVRISLLNFGPFDESGSYRIELRYTDQVSGNGFEG